MAFGELFNSFNENWSIRLDGGLSIELRSRNSVFKIPISDIIELEFLGDTLTRTTLYLVDEDTIIECSLIEDHVTIRFNDIIRDRDINEFNRIYTNLLRELLNVGLKNVEDTLLILSEKLLDDISAFYELLKEYSAILGSDVSSGRFTGLYIERNRVIQHSCGKQFNPPCILICPDKIMEFVKNDSRFFVNMFKATYIMQLARSVMDVGCKYNNGFINLIYERGLSSYIALEILKRRHVGSNIASYIKLFLSQLPIEYQLYGFFSMSSNMRARPLVRKPFDLRYDEKVDLASIISTYFIIPNAVPLLTSIVDLGRGFSLSHKDNLNNWLWIWRSLKALRLGSKYSVLDLLLFIPILNYYQKYFYTV